MAQGSRGTAVWRLVDGAARGHTRVLHGVRALAGAGRSLAWIDPRGRPVLADDRARPTGPPLRLGSCSRKCQEDPLLAVSADGKHAVAGAANDALVILDVDDRRVVTQLERARDHASIEAVAISADGRHVAEGLFKGGFVLRDTESPRGAVPLNLPGSDPEDAASSSATSLAFSPDGRYLAVGNGDGQVRLWSVRTQTPVGPPWNDPETSGWGTARDLMFDERGAHVAAWIPPALTIWDFRLSDWAARACARAGRVFTRAEWRRFVPGEPYRSGCRS